MPKTKEGKCEKCGGQDRELFGVNAEDFIPENYPKGGTTITRFICRECLRG